MSSSQEKILFAARRWKDPNGTSNITLFILQTGERYPVQESILKEQTGCVLGDFLSWIGDKLVKKTGWKTSIIGDLAYIENVRAKLINLEGLYLFHSAEFGNSLCRHQNLNIESFYDVKIRLFLNEHKLSSGTSVHFEAVEATSVSNEAPSTSETPILTSGQKKSVVVGAGFAPAKPKEEKIVVGAGFAVKPQKIMKLKAVVLSIREDKRTGSNTHFLWILDNKTEGRFFSKDYKLLPGHFFEGTFIENVTEKWDCKKYEKPFEKPSDLNGGLDQTGKIWFEVRIENFRPAGGNRRFGDAQAKYFGEVIEGELESTKLSSDCNGKQVKIQRKRIGDKDYVWMVVEVL